MKYTLTITQTAQFATIQEAAKALSETSRAGFEVQYAFVDTTANMVSAGLSGLSEPSAPLVTQDAETQAPAPAPAPKPVKPKAAAKSDAAQARAPASDAATEPATAPAPAPASDGPVSADDPSLLALRALLLPVSKSSPEGAAKVKAFVARFAPVEDPRLPAVLKSKIAQALDTAQKEFA